MRLSAFYAFTNNVLPVVHTVLLLFLFILGCQLKSGDGTAIENQPFSYLWCIYIYQYVNKCTLSPFQNKKN